MPENESRACGGSIAETSPPDRIVLRVPDAVKPGPRLYVKGRRLLFRLFIAERYETARISFGVVGQAEPNIERYRFSVFL